MIIREATLDDLEGLVDLFDGYRIFYRKVSDKAASKDFLAARMQQQESKIYVCEVDQKLAGFTQLYPLFSSTRMRKLWLLNDLYVDQSFRGRGISIQLIERAKQLVRDTTALGMFLETEKSNVIGNQLYPRTGFHLNKEANYYEWTAE